MKSKELFTRIAEKKFVMDEFVQLALNDPIARNEIVCGLLSNPAIMVYYHCYEVVKKASKKQPELFLEYWDEFAGLLHHPNSYHRDFALEIIANLTKVDHQNRFAENQDAYFRLINDEKFMTGNCCVNNLRKIFHYKPDQQNRVLDLLMDTDNCCEYTEKQKALLKADVLEILDDIYDQSPDQGKILKFFRAQLGSLSPKTRKKARELARKYNLKGV